MTLRISFVTTVAVAGFLLRPCSLSGQSKPAFEVASVRPLSGPMSLAPSINGDRVVWPAMLPMLVEYAFDVSFSEISGTVPQGFYDIEAIAPGSPKKAELRLMFQDLLERRFGMKYRREPREMTVLALQVGPKGSKLKATQEGFEVKIDGRPIGAAYVGNFLAVDGQHVAGKAASMDQLVRVLSDTLNVNVVDETGIHGEFDFDLVHAGESAPLHPDMPSLRTAIEELGLRLVSAKRMIPVLVVEKIGSPSEN